MCPPRNFSHSTQTSAGFSGRVKRSVWIRWADPAHTSVQANVLADPSVTRWGLTMVDEATQPPTAVGLQLDEEAVQRLVASTRGTVLRAGQDGYDAARTVWNGMIDRSPALIVRCVSAADVVAAVNFARNHNLLLAVRGGGHSAAGSGVCDRGLMIDLSRMNGIRVDPARRTVRAEAGLTWAEFDRETEAFGLATTARFDHWNRRTHPRRRYRLARSHLWAKLR